MSSLDGNGSDVGMKGSLNLSYLQILSSFLYIHLYIAGHWPYTVATYSVRMVHSTGFSASTELVKRGMGT